MMSSGTWNGASAGLEGRMAVRRPPTRRVPLGLQALLRAVPFTVLLWFSLWLNIGSGYWHLRNPQGLRGLFHAFRAVLPFVAAFVVAGMSGGRPYMRASSKSPFK